MENLSEAPVQIEEDEHLFLKLMQKLKLSSDPQNPKLHRLHEILKKAEERDISHELDRYFGDRIYNSRDPELLELVRLIQTKGYKSQAISWLKSTTPEGMKHGTAHRIERILEARKWAQRAKIPLEEIASELNININY
jgi:hypothetical protein